MRSASIHHILRKVLFTTAASAAASACSSIDTDGFEPPVCTNEVPSLLADVRPAEPADYVELRLRADGIEGEDQLVETSGTACASASDRGACQAAIDDATTTVGIRIQQCIDFCDEHYLVVNRGDDVEVIDTEDGLRELLGEVDTAGEAVASARLAGYQVACAEIEEGGVKATGDGYEVIATKVTSSCTPYEVSRYQLAVSRAGEVAVLEDEVYDSESGACAGRRPSCMEAQRARGKSPLGAYFASVAHLEELAVHAFAELARELAHHGAPAELIARAEASRRDEVRHTRVMRALAERFGGQAPRARATAVPPRSLEAFARDNAVEGCVRETYGALVGMWQGEHAGDPRVRAVMRRVAADEARHAALSWDIDRWARSRLDDAAIARIDAARAQALRALEDEAAADAELVHMAGLPSAATHRELVRRFAAELAA